MRRTAISVFTLAIVLACAACGSAGDDSSSEEPSSAAAPSGSSDASARPGQPAGQECAGQTWPQPIPDFRGTALGETVVGAGLCFGIGSVTAVDGRDVMNDPASHTIPWTITDQSPAPGTSVTAETPVTLTVDTPH